MLFLTDCGTKLPVQKVGKQIIQTREKKKKWGTGFVTLSGSIREEITKKGGEGRNSRESDNCMYFFKTLFIWGKSGNKTKSCSSIVFKDGSIASSLQP